MMTKRFVFDTNALVSAIFSENSISAKAFDKAVFSGNIAMSEATLSELVEVLFRKKFDKYFLNDDERWLAIDNVSSKAMFFSPSETITDCRDPKDNMFLELAVASNADCIVTGDKALRELDPFRGCRIIGAAEFLELF
ncbi:MAG: putative toxin-antitoxin system toxin component, PIN family [Bergeyella sp.]